MEELNSLRPAFGLWKVSGGEAPFKTERFQGFALQKLEISDEPYYDPGDLSCVVEQPVQLNVSGRMGRLELGALRPGCWGLPARQHKGFLSDLPFFFCCCCHLLKSRIGPPQPPQRIPRQGRQAEISEIMHHPVSLSSALKLGGFLRVAPSSSLEGRCTIPPQHHAKTLRSILPYAPVACPCRGHRIPKESSSFF